MSWRTIRVARLLVVAVSLGLGIAYVIVRSGEYEPADVTAYWDAAMRLRAGEPLYVIVPDPEAPEVFRYAPWFALAWVPLTFLPREPVLVAWWLGMIVLAAYGLWRVARLGAAGLAIAGLIGPFLVWIAARGNVHPLVLVPLMLGVEGRAGPILVGVMASLKATPLAFALVYLGRREWRRFAVALGTFAVLVAPIALFGTAGFQADPGRYPNPLLEISPVAWLAAVSLLCVATVVTAARWPSHAWWVAGLAAMAGVARFLPYNLTYLLVGLAPALAWLESRERGRSASPTAR